MNAYWSAGFNLLSAVIGAVIGGGATVWAQVRSADNQRRERDKDEADLIRGFVQAIADELQSFWDRFGQEIGPHLQSLPDDAVARVFPLHQSYFVVFDSNASLIGRVPDRELREQIISIYVEAKGFVDSMQHYERMVTSYDDYWQTMTVQQRAQEVLVSVDSSQGPSRGQILTDNLKGYSRKLKTAYSLLQAKAQKLKSPLQAYLAF